MSIKKIVLYYILIVLGVIFLSVIVGDVYLQKSNKTYTRILFKENLSEFVNLFDNISVEKDTDLIDYYFSNRLSHYKNLKYIGIYKKMDSTIVCLRKKIGVLSSEMVNLLQLVHSHDTTFVYHGDTLYLNTPEGEFFLVKLNQDSPYYLGAVISPIPLSTYHWFFLGSRIFLLLLSIFVIFITTTVGLKKTFINNLNKIANTITRLQRDENAGCEHSTGIDEFDEVCKELSELSLHMKKRYQKYYEDSIRDPLTGAFNLRKFYDDLETERKECMTHKTGFVLLIIDVDNFKSINDTLGHLAGDKALKEIVYIIKRNIRDTDSVYRYGGDEFTVILRNTDDEGAYRIAERIRKEVEKNTTTTVSIGGSYFFIAYTAVELMREADRKLYIAKKLGKNRTIIMWEDTENTFNQYESDDI